MSVLDETIRLAGRSVQIIRDTGNVDTYMYYTSTGRTAGKFKLNPDDDHETGFLFPSDSGVQSGDLVYAGSDYYLVVSLTDLVVFGEVWGYKGLLYKCNSVVTVRHWNATTSQFEDYKTGVRCLITQERAQGWMEDKSLLQPVRYRGKRQPFTLYAQTSSGIDIHSRIVDQDGREFRVGKDQNPFTSGGILITQVMWEN